jgi:hypothetical protein
MSQENGIDLIRWTFTVNSDNQADIEDYLIDMGMDVSVDDEGHFCVTWEEPDVDTDPIIAHIWEINGTPFDITHESFHRLNLLIYHHDEEAEAAA